MWCFQDFRSVVLRVAFSVGSIDFLRWVVDPFRAGEFTPTRALPHCSGVRRGVYLCEAWVDVAMVAFVGYLSGRFTTTRACVELCLHHYWYISQLKPVEQALAPLARILQVAITNVECYTTNTTNEKKNLFTRGLKLLTLGGNG